MLRPSNINREESEDGRPIEKKEVRRRNRVKATKFWVVVYINDKKMATTQVKKISWPNFEVEFREKFQIFLYTKPYSVKLEICTGGGLVTRVLDTIEVDIPGENVNTLTSAVSLIRTLDFKQVKVKKTKVKVLNTGKGKDKSGDKIEFADGQKDEDNEEVKELNAEEKDGAKDPKDDK